jgi:hypothetical protein
VMAHNSSKIIFFAPLFDRLYRVAMVLVTALR